MVLSAAPPQCGAQPSEAGRPRPVPAFRRNGTLDDHDHSSSRIRHDEGRPTPAQGPLFLNRRGQRLRPHPFRPKLRAFAEQAGVKRAVTPHMLRHRAATLLIESGVDIRMVQRLRGLRA
ncbi:tyrosine-type recombinase/integrase [Bradyrhizobium sp. DASA03005]|uniref:tyrosine-type recombinase/integrase n=1 Tax=Bradyrhizobium sp. SPXBL-02 TaxID=3395912 RepID=UPI003F6F3B30